MKLKRRRTVRRKARIEIIPLIDIMFFLLATFVMVSTAMIRNKGIAVNLPSAQTGAAEDRSDYAAVTVTSTGELYFNKEKLAIEGLGLKLAELKASAADPKIFVNGDMSVHLGAVVKVLDEIRKAGISKVALETKADV